MTLNFFGPHNNLADHSIACAVCLASARATMTPAKLTLIAPFPGQESTMVAPLLTPPHPRTTSPAHAPCYRVGWVVRKFLIGRVYSQMVDGQFLTGRAVTAVGQFFLLVELIGIRAIPYW